jgi:hypothetical protein
MDPNHSLLMDPESASRHLGRDAATHRQCGVITTAENLMSLSEAAHSLPHRPHISTLWRWCKKGCRGARLEYLRLGGRIFTSAEALRRFGARLATLDDNPPAPAPKTRRSPDERAAAVAAAKAKLDNKLE